MPRRTRRKIKRRRASRRLKQRGGGGDPAAAAPELPDEIAIELATYTPYYVKSCRAKTQPTAEAAGQWVSIHRVDPHLYGAFIDNDMLPKADEIVKKVVDEKTLAGHDDGIFTYFVYLNRHAQNFVDPEAVRIGCIKIRSGLEFGTSHMNLADYLGLLGLETFGTRTAHLLFAGEFKKVGATITFNFQSGTFLQTHDTSLSPDELALTRNRRVEVMKALLGKLGLVGIFTGETLITENTPYFTDAESGDLTGIGLLINKFGTERECIAYSPPEKDDEDGDED
jgi:hypothetical protein